MIRRAAAMISGREIFGVAPGEAGTASGILNSARQLGGAIGLASLATVAAHNTGSVNDGYANALIVAAGLYVVAAVVAATVLPRAKHVPVDAAADLVPAAETR
ncbi:hypothetical protein [Actinomadura sp. 6N118]|uniref:hypothetical protein n=1 Tax=Actinomadura sp. 6N118 TaxID=3375151 RepID=UPI0037B17137